MTKIKIAVENCNNISKGEICLEEEKLNIKYGMNGIGKSTISTAIDLYSQNKSLMNLKTFGSDENVNPRIFIDKDIQRVKVFNENFVNNMVFKESTIIENAFDIFIRTPDYEERRKNLDNKLFKLKMDIANKPEIIQLRRDIEAFSGKLELNSARKKIKNNTNYKAIVKKNNLYNVPVKLNKYLSIISDEQICINWIDWKLKGDAFATKGICPYCADKLNDDFVEEKQVFRETYKKSDAQNLKNILDLFENFRKYIHKDNYDSIISCIKEGKDESAIEVILIKFLSEYIYISNKLNKIIDFDKNVFKKVNIKDIDEILEEMKFGMVFSDFSSEIFNNIINEVNDSIDELIKEANDINAAMGKLQTVLKKTVKTSKKVINDFLDSAGINYHVEINYDDKGKAIATMQYIHENQLVEVDEIRKHLSWGEKNAFSLILFMFYAISEDANLIVLDDPISSFDTNKKYAIMHRMFSKQNGNLQRSFYKKTVLMLTHDFEPIIDFGVIGKLPCEALNCMFIQNSKGILNEKAIEFTHDVKPVVQALTTYINDENLNVVHRIAFLRKYYEHNGIENFKDAYDVLSSLIHGRKKCTYSNGIEMPQIKIEKGINEIEKWINNFNYDELFRRVYNEDYLVKQYFLVKNKYLKIQLFRALFEVNPNKKLKEDVLIKFINESYHIENDYAYYLDMIKFETVPEYIINVIDDYMIRSYPVT